MEIKLLLIAVLVCATQANLFDLMNIQNIESLVLGATTTSTPLIYTDYKFEGKIFLYDSKNSRKMSEQGYMKVKAKHGYSLSCSYAKAEAFNSAGTSLATSEVSQCKTTQI
jgi:hypothetical protein